MLNDFNHCIQYFFSMTMFYSIIIFFTPTLSLAIALSSKQLHNIFSLIRLYSAMEDNYLDLLYIPMMNYLPRLVMIRASLFGEDIN